MACVGRLEPGPKGQDILLQVLAQPEWRARQMEVNFFGEGSHETTLRRMQTMLRLNNVHFRGHVDNVAAIWEENHILALPSRYEGLPLALVEAMWCGRPAVVTDVAGNAELCLDGQTGFVAQSATPASFANAMERAWQSRGNWKQMGHVAHGRVKSLIPTDPIGVFCERLKACVASNVTTAQPIQEQSRKPSLSDRSRRPLPRSFVQTIMKSIISLTFDDGLLCHFEQALPILDRYRIPATFFLVANADRVLKDGLPHPRWKKTRWSNEDVRLFAHMTQSGHKSGRTAYIIDIHF